jgi:hydroxymethylglutaryl-CoA reductase
MSSCSRIPGFGSMSTPQRLDALEVAGFLSSAQRAWLESSAAEAGLASPAENGCGVLRLPLSLAPNFRINGRDRVLPMLTEEASVVAGAARVASLLRDGAGLLAQAGERLLGGQILWRYQGRLEDLERGLAPHREALLETLNSAHPRLLAAGGGLRDLGWRPGPEPGLQVLELQVHTADAMGAHLVDRLAEELAGALVGLLPGNPVTCIVSNRPLGRWARVEAQAPVAALARAGRSAEAVARDVELLCSWALGDGGRWPTHLKGALNGTFAVLRAFSQDDRAVAAAIASAAAEDPARLLPRWRVEGPRLLGFWELPLPLGLTGLGLERPPLAILASLAGVERAGQLEEFAIAAGLAQNLAALQILVTDGIVKGHGVLHGRRGEGRC